MRDVITCLANKVAYVCVSNWDWENPMASGRCRPPLQNEER